MADNTYLVLFLSPSAGDAEPPPETAVRAQYLYVGEFEARSPEAAIEAAGEAHGLPDDKGTEAVAVPRRYWHNRGAKTKTVIEITEPPGAPTEPPAGGPKLPDAAGDDLDPRLDPEQPCEYEKDGVKCAHLPGEHGSKGLGMCRVDGCPCGVYTPKPGSAA